MKDYDANIQYHPGKANVVVDAVSRKTYGKLSCLSKQPEINRDLEHLMMGLYISGTDGWVASMRIESDLISRIKKAQLEDGDLWAMFQNL